jgi:tetratricopeptide (TPR) repeat protein
MAPDNPFALQNLAVALDMSGDRSAAIELYEKSLRIYDRNPVVLNNLAYHMAESGGDLDRALTLAQRALQANPGFSEYLDTIGWIYLKKGLVDAALEEFRKLVQMEPAHPGYRHHLGAAHAEKGETAAAKKELQKALDLKPRPDEAAAIRRLLRQLGES